MNLYLDDDTAERRLVAFLVQAGHGVVRPVEVDRMGASDAQHLIYAIQHMYPAGVTASRGYDHRGHCFLFAHHTLGALGKIVLQNMRDGSMVLHAEFYQGQTDVESPLVQQKKHVFERVVAIVNNGFNKNFSKETSS